MTKQWKNKEKFDILEFGSAKTYVGEKTLKKSEESIFQDEKAIKTQWCGKLPKNTKSSCTVYTSEAVLCSTAFHSSLNLKQANKLKSIQKTCLRIFLGEDYISYELALVQQGCPVAQAKKKNTARIPNAVKVTIWLWIITPQCHDSIFAIYRL